MLSDYADRVGGETALSNENGLQLLRTITSLLGDLYHQLAEYHFKLLQDRSIRLASKNLFVEQIESLKHMNEEIADDDNVQRCLRRQSSFRDQEQARTSVECTREQKNKVFKCDECSRIGK
ncbi:hypothetical protein N7467_002480 [Penicillium canescens]|nr:hypothetical protein N7467_002480 [Penicillium canescens]